jgi:hypothetical protein
VIVKQELICGRPLAFGDWEQIQELKKRAAVAKPKHFFDVVVKYDQPVTRRIVVAATSRDDAEAVVALHLPEGAWFEVLGCEDTGKLAMPPMIPSLGMFDRLAEK